VLGQVPEDQRAAREATLEMHSLPLEHYLRHRGLSPRLLACMRVLAADGTLLAAMLHRDADPFQVRVV
jgi:hypothetical protein